MVDDFRRRLAEALWPPAKAIRVHPDEDDFCQRNIMPTVDRIQRIRDAELESWRERAETAEAAIARVRALHKPFQRRDKVAYCDHCSVSAGSPWRRYVLVPWPCETLAALDDTREDETRG